MSTIYKGSYLEEITRALSYLSAQVKLNNAINKYSINIEAEDFYAGFLNVVYGYKLKSGNHANKPMAYIDLFEESCRENGEKVAVQVTSRNDPEKIKETLKGFSEHNENGYTRLIILMITEKKKYRTRFAFSAGTGITFDQKRDILDVNDLIRDIDTVNDLDHLSRIYEYLRKNLLFSFGPSISESEKDAFKSAGIRDRIINASISQRKELFSGSTKFKGLEIFEGLLPDGQLEKEYDKPFGIDQDGEVSPLQDHYQNSQDKNLILIGEGGIGKTTFLAHLMTSIIPLDDRKVIPFYIELNCCPQEIGNWYSSRLKKTNFITRYIASVMDNRDLEEYSSDDLAELEKTLGSQQDVQLLLLLDGLNEVNIAHATGKKAGETIRDLLRQEISVLSRYPSVRIILTTRAISDGYIPEGFRNIWIKGLEDEKIRQYLRHNQFTETDIKWISVNRSLMDCLRVPLFLCMFACRNQYEPVHPTAKGEILYHFFHRGTPFYSEKRKYKEMFAYYQSERKYLAFIEDFLLPAMAYDMYIRGDFQLSKKRMTKCLNDALNDPLMEYAADTSGFTDYEMQSSTLKNVYDSVKQLNREVILERCVDVLGILYSAVGNGLVRYGFIHHHIRDYFAAYYIVQRIRCALYYYAEKREEDPKCTLDQDTELYLNIRGALEPIYYEKLDKNTQRFVGEILGEHRNVLQLKDQKRWIPAERVFEEQNTLENVLGMFRYQKAESRNTIDNVVEILKTVRNSLSNVVFDGLDLTKCCLYETICSSGMDDLKVSASFRNCLISDQTFMFRGHLGDFRDIKVSVNNNLLFTYGEDDQVCIWEISSMHRKVHFSTANAIYHEAHSPYKQKIVVSSTNEFLIAWYDEEYTEGRITAVRSVIDCYTLSGQVLHLTEGGERREISCMNFSYDGNILGVWGKDTLRIFDSEDGRLLRTVRFNIDGEITGVFLSADGYILLQVEVEEKQDSVSVIKSCKYALYELNLETGMAEIILEYDTAKNVIYGERLPAFDVDQSGRVYIYYSQGGLHMFDLLQKNDKTIWQFEEGTVPARIKILNQESLTTAVQWNDRVLLLSADGEQSVLYENSALSDAEICAFANNKVFFVNGSKNLMQWNLDTDDLIEDVIPKIKLKIKNLQQDRDGHIMVTYSNSCILTVDTKQGVLIDTFFSNENDAVLEASLFLQDINRQLIVLRTPQYEQLILYDNRTGIIQRVDVYSYEHLAFVTALTQDTTLFIGFDRKVIAIDLVTMKQTEIWRQKGGEILFDMEVGPDTAALLLQWKMLCRRPIYKIYSGSVETGVEETGVRNVDFIDFRLAKDLMVEKESDYVYYGMDALSDQLIYSVKGILWSEGSSDLKRYFMLVKSAREFSIFLYLDNKTTLITQSDSDWLVTVTDYKDIHIFNKRSGEETNLQIADPENSESSLKIADALVCENHKIYCATTEDKVIQADAETGLPERKYDFMPGIIVSGCDFTGSQMSENTKKVLIQHGAVFH